MAFDFNGGYNRNNFINFLRTDLFRNKFVQQQIPVKPERKTAFFVENGIFQLGTIQLGEEEISVFEIKQSSRNDPRVTLTQDTFKLMGDLGIDNAIVALYVDDKSSWRFSLLTTKYEDFKKTTSNPKRFSFILGPNEKIRTVNQQLIKKGEIKDFDDLVSRFDVEVVRQEFFETYLELFVRLYKEILKDKPFADLLSSQNVDLVSFTKNLLGKIIFLYFVQQKGWLSFDKNTKYGDGNKNFMRELWNNFKKESESMTEEKTGYFYNDYLEWLFFAGLNVDRRNDNDRLEELKTKVPYLNGGLFREEYDGWEDNNSKINNNIFSNKDEDGILDIFDRYNFTIDEDSLYDTDIAVDPEMLGRIFEKMISISSENINDVLAIYNKKKANTKFDFGKDLNKKLGAFYTPREIVHYMTKESLIAYLQSKTNISEDNIRIVFDLKEKFLLNSADMKKAEYSTEKLMEIGNSIKDIDEALKSVKILDPAVGSGAFPMGLLHEISSLRYYMYGVFNKIFEEKTNDYKNKDGKISLYKIKKDIILHNIHGVDIDPGAIDIAKLRFRLSLVVDEQEPEPLPNFEFKFVCANSLVPLKKGSLFTKSDVIEKLKRLREDYYKCNNLDKKEELKSEFENIKRELTGFGKIRSDFQSKKEWNEYQIQSYSANTDLRNRQISERDPFDTKDFSKRLDTDLMMGQDKFDIVIGNPPYVSSRNMGDELKKFYVNEYKTAIGHYDLYVLFFERGLNLLNIGGNINYITSNKFLSQKYGLGLRKLFLKNRIKSIVNFNFDVFSNATVDTSIMLVEKSESSYDGDIRVNNILEKEDYKDFLNNKYYLLRQDSFKKMENNLFRLNISDADIPILNKIKENSVKLEDICYVSKGAELHSEKSLGISKDEYIFEIKKSDDLKPYIEGKYFSKYEINKTAYLNYCPQKHKAPIFKEFFEADKLIFKNVIGKLGIQGIYDSVGYYNNDAINNAILYKDLYGLPYSQTKSITKKMAQFSEDFDLKYLLAILNSKLITYYYKKLIGFGLHFYPSHLRELPIKLIDKAQQTKFSNYVDSIMDNPQDQELINKLDKMIYELYGLTDEEVQIVEDSLK